MRAARRVIMYLYNTRHLKIVYRRPDELRERNVPVIHEGAKHTLDNGLIPGAGKGPGVRPCPTGPGVLGLIKSEARPGPAFLGLSY